MFLENYATNQQHLRGVKARSLGRQLTIYGGENQSYVLTRAALGSPAERAAWGGGGKYYLPANSRTRGRNEAGEAAIESSQRVLSGDI